MEENVKHVKIVTIDDKHQIMTVLTCTLDSIFLLAQLIFQRSVIYVCLPSNWHITLMDNHWSNKSTTIDYLEYIVISYVCRKNVKQFGTYAKYPALAIFDIFKGQCTSDVLQILKDHNILYVTICTN